MGPVTKAYLWLSMPVVFLIALYGAVQQMPDFITVYFTWVWFVMVLVIMTASLGLLAQGLQIMKHEDELEDGEPEEPKKAAH